MEAVVYLRQSQDRTGEELAVTRQREDARKLATARSWTVIAEHVDNDLSASGKRRRPGFNAIIEAIETGEAKAVIAWDMNRLTRNRRDSLRLLEVGEKAGATLAFVRGSDLDLSTPAGRLTAEILMGVARHEIDQKSDRQRRAALQAAQQGRRIGGRRPFGYEADGVTVRPAEAEALRGAYEAVLSGVPVARAATNLNRAGFHTPQLTHDGQPSPWTAQALRMTLANPRNAALRAHKGEIMGAAQWPAIVSEDIWRAACAILMDPARSVQGRIPIALLTNIARCDICLAPVHRGANRYHQPVYRCRESTGHVARASAPIDEYVSAAVVKRLSRPDAAELLIDQERPDVDEMRNEAMALRARLDMLALNFAEGELTPSQLRTATGRLRSRITEIEGHIADAGRVNILGPLIASGDVSAEWKRYDIERQRAVVDVLMDIRLLSVGRGVRTFRPETVGITWKDQLGETV